MLKFLFRPRLTYVDALGMWLSIYATQTYGVTWHWFWIVMLAIFVTTFIEWFVQISDH